jgi:hypothetical protein
MLRITINRTGAVETWELEGKLSGDWVKELDRCWKESVHQAGIAVELRLKAVSYIDSSGKQLLAKMYGNGVDIKGCGCMARAVVEEIVANADARGSQARLKKVLAVIVMFFVTYVSAMK